MLALEVAILNERGGRSYNEDACGHWHADGRLCCVLADGAGGHGGGQVAARIAVERLLQLYSERPSAEGFELHELVRATNQAVRAERTDGTERANMHSTVVCVVIDYAQHLAHWAHAGDSRLYWFRNHRVHACTKDHSMVQALVERGLLTIEQAREHPKRSELRSALGSDEGHIEIDHSGPARVVLPGDVFLLCTDGVWEPVPDATLEATLAASTTANGWLDSIERAVIEATAHHGHHDNFSAIAIWTVDAPAQGETGQTGET